MLCNSFSLQMVSETRLLAAALSWHEKEVRVAATAAAAARRVVEGVR